MRENGRPVDGVSVTPADAADARHFGVVLALDTSHSMNGAPLQAAITAAREFVRNRIPGQPVAVVAFSHTVDDVLAFSTDTAAIDRALAGIRVTPRPPSGGGTRLLDAAQRGVELVRGAQLASGSVVVVSDGADRNSEATIDAVAAAALEAHTRVFAVGLASHGHDFGVPNLLAAATHGEFSLATSLTDLSRIYGRLGSRLGNQYLVRYRSSAQRGRPVAVEVRVRGEAGSASTTYRAPAIKRAIRPPFEHVPAERLWRSPAAAVGVGLIVAALVFTALWLLLRPREGRLRQRMASWVEPPEEPVDDARREGGSLAGRVLVGAERSLDGRDWWVRYTEALDVAGIATPPVRIVAWVALGTGAALMLFPLVGGSPAFAVLALGIPVGAWQFINRRVTRQRSLFTDQMPDSMQIVASAMRAGHSFAGALAVLVEDAPEPTRRELQRVIADERLGVPLDTAFASAVRRMKSKDLEQVALVATLQRETGGNTAEVIDRVTETVRERLAVRRLVATLTAQGKLSRWVLTAVPIVLLAFMTAVNPEYMNPLFSTSIGKVLLTASAVMVTAGSLVIKRIVNIKV